MKTAIVYYSMSGNTKAVAEKISDKLGAETIEIRPVKEYPSEGAQVHLGRDESGDGREAKTAAI